MTQSTVIGFTGVTIFVTVIGVIAYYLTKWGEETKKRQEEFLKNPLSSKLIEEDGTELILEPNPKP